jgi:hypothetical protein
MVNSLDFLSVFGNPLSTGLRIGRRGITTKDRTSKTDEGSNRDPASWRDLCFLVERAVSIDERTFPVSERFLTNHTNTRATRRETLQLASSRV